MTFDEDVGRAVERLRREQGLGLSEAVNRLVRRGLRAADEPREPFEQETRELGLSVDVSDVAEAIELLDGAHEV